jgi:hypothetical protein
LQVINYLNTTKNLVIIYKAPKGAIVLTINMFAISASTSSSNLGFYSYSDAAFADSYNCKSTSSYVFILAGSAICYCLVKQRLITTLTIEVEYIALTYAAKEAT